MDPSKYAEAAHDPANPIVVAFFDGQDTAFTCTFVVVDKANKKCAILDSSYNFDPASGVIETRSIDKVIAFVKEQGLETQFILETHPHADHLSAAQYVKRKLGGQCCIGAHVTSVQAHFAKFFNLVDFPTDGSQFDRLFHEGDTFTIGSIKCSVVHTPGHTPACITYVIGNTLFCGDVLFMPDMGSARCDFPGGSAETLWNSIQKILAFPPEYRMFPAHDYAPEGRPYKWETTVGEQLQSNKHVKTGTTKEAFIEFRTKRDRELKVPQLLYPSLQINIRAGHLPAAEGDDKAVFLKTPLTLKES